MKSQYHLHPMLLWLCITRENPGTVTKHSSKMRKIIYIKLLIEISQTARHFLNCFSVNYKVILTKLYLAIFKKSSEISDFLLDRKALMVLYYN